MICGRKMSVARGSRWLEPPYRAPRQMPTRLCRRRRAALSSPGWYRPRRLGKESFVVPVVVRSTTGKLENESGGTPVANVELQWFCAMPDGIPGYGKKMIFILGVKPLNDMFLMKGKSAGLVAKDAKGRILEGCYMPFFSESQVDGSMSVRLDFEDVPQGGWISVESLLPLECAKGKTALPARAIPSVGEGTFDAGGMHFNYKCYADSDKSGQPTGKTHVELEYTRIPALASIRMLDSKGCDRGGEGGGCWNGNSVSQSWRVETPPDGRILVSVSLWDGVRELNVPIKFRMNAGADAHMENGPVQPAK